MNRRRFLAATGLLSLSGCMSDSGGDDGGAEVGGEGTVSVEQPVEIVESAHKTVAETKHYLIGRVRNNTDETQRFQVRVDWVGEDGTVLGETFSQVRAEVAAGGKRAFETTFYDAEDHGEPAEWRASVHVY